VRTLKANPSSITERGEQLFLLNRALSGFLGEISVWRSVPIDHLFHCDQLAQ
jgi:hypothetical protein